MNSDQMKKRICSINQVQVFGAGILARRMLECCKYYGNPNKISCFIVSNKKDNPNDIMGIPVYEVGDKGADAGKETWLVLKNKTSWNLALDLLLENGYRNIIHISSGFSEKIYLQSMYESKVIEYIKKQDSRAFSRIGSFLENGFCDFIICENRNGKNREYKWRFYYASLREHIDKDEVFLPQGRILESFEEIYGPYRILSEELNKLEIQNTYEKKPVMRVYMTRCAADNYEIDVTFPEWLVPIQVGAALTEKRIYDVTDNVGDNISNMNLDYSECTALYWMWKNVHDVDYIGLYHYSRHMNIPEDNIYAIAAAGIDIVVTYPMLSGNVHDFFVPTYIPEFDWKLMEKSVLKHYPEYSEDLMRYHDTYFYPGANLSIMKKSIFDNYAEFCFTVMKDITDFYRERQIIREDRYAGYIMENLTALFVMHNKDKYRIAFTDFRYLKS